MANLTLDFLKYRNKLSRHKKFAMPILGFAIFAVVTAGAVYLVKNHRVAFDDSDIAEGSGQLPKSWLMKYFGTPNSNHVSVGGDYGDPDDDILTNYQEYLFGTDPTKEDTDNDGDIDSYEVAFGQNPNGENNLVLTDQARDYVKELIESDKKYSEFSQANLSAEINRSLQTERAVVLDFPQDAELIISKQDDPQSLEKYFEDTKGLLTADDADFQNVQERLFDGLTDQELNFYIEKFRATEDVLKKIAAPAQAVNIQKMKVAGLRAGMRLFELVRDRFEPDREDNQFWADAFYQIAAIKQVGTLEVLMWRDLGQELKDTGGWEEIQK